MKNFSSETGDLIFKFLYNKISVKDIEKWVYENESLKDLFGEEKYLELLEFNYNKEYAAGEVKHLITLALKEKDSEKFYKEQLLWLLEGLIEGKLDIISALRAIAKLSYEKEDLIPFIFIGYESELDDVPCEDEYHQWDKKALQEKLKKIDWYRKNIMEDSKKLFKQLKGSV